MTGIASYVTTSPKHMLVLLFMSAAVVVATQVFSILGGTSVSPGVDAAALAELQGPELTTLFNAPRPVPLEMERTATQPVANTDPVSSQPSDEPTAVEDEVVVQVEIDVPEDPARLQGGTAEPLLLRPTFSWVNAFSNSSTIGGQLVGVGDVITAFDPDGTLIGHFTVTNQGQFGLMALYQDDPSTAIDEGADPGDVISFEINGIPVVANGPQEPIWTSNGSVLLVTLSGS